jgi:hypothetical protein
VSCFSKFAARTESEFLRCFQSKLSSKFTTQNLEQWGKRLLIKIYFDSNNSELAINNQNTTSILRVEEKLVLFSSGNDRLGTYLRNAGSVGGGGGEYSPGEGTWLSDYWLCKKTFITCITR